MSAHLSECFRREFYKRLALPIQYFSSLNEDRKLENEKWGCIWEIIDRKASTLAGLEAFIRTHSLLLNARAFNLTLWKCLILRNHERTEGAQKEDEPQAIIYR